MSERRTRIRRAVAQWIEKADEDIWVAKLILRSEPVAAFSATFHCQQSVEKTLKAYLTLRQCEFPKTHDIGKLLELIHGLDPGLVTAIESCVWLTDYAVTGRYPGDIPEPSEEVARRAFESAESCRRFIGIAMEQIDEPG